MRAIKMSDGVYIKPFPSHLGLQQQPQQQHRRVTFIFEYSRSYTSALASTAWQ